MAEITGKEHQPETNKRTLHWPLATGHWPQWLVGDGSDTGDGASSELQVSVRDDTCIRIYTGSSKAKMGDWNAATCTRQEPVGILSSL